MICILFLNTLCQSRIDGIGKVRKIRFFRFWRNEAVAWVGEKSERERSESKKGSSKETSQSLPISTKTLSPPKESKEI